MSSILDSFKLNGKVAIVTGASRGLGAGMALALAEAGANVALVARGDTVGSSRVDLQACKLEYSIVSPK